MNYKTITAYLVGGCLFAGALNANTSEEEWYDASDWFDGDDVDYDASQDQNRSYDQADNRYDNQGWSDNMNDEVDGYAVYTIYTVRTNPNGENTWQESQNNSWRNNANRSASNRDQSTFSQQSQQVQGKIKSLETVKFSDGSQSKAHCLATVKLDQGPTLLMTLGEKKGLKKLDLEKGDQVTIEGSTGEVGGSLIFVADKISSNGKHAQLDNAMAQVAGKRSMQGQRFSQNEYGSNQNQYGSTYQNQNRSSQNQYGSNQNDRMNQRGQWSNSGQQDRQFVRGSSNEYDRSANQQAWRSSPGDRNYQSTDYGSNNDYRSNDNARSSNNYYNSSNERDYQSYDSSRDQQQVRGEVESFRKISLQGEKDRHQLIKLRMEDGSSEIINLGSEASLSDLDLQQGDRVHVKGQEKFIDGRSVIFADKLKIDDQRQLN